VDHVAGAHDLPAVQPGRGTVTGATSTAISFTSSGEPNMSDNRPPSPESLVRRRSRVLTGGIMFLVGLGCLATAVTSAGDAPVTGPRSLQALVVGGLLLTAGGLASAVLGR
jgi:hypothetical protein